MYNVDAAVSCALPYHATPAFVRLLQVLQLEGTRWAFLGAVRLQGAPPTRQALVQCIARDPGLVALVGDAATVSAGGKLGSAAAASFYTLLLAEAVASMARVPEAVLARLMVFLAAGLDKAAPVEQQAGALLVLTQMADRVQLAPAVTESLLVSLAKTARPPLEPYALQAMLQLARTQALTALPAPTVAYLAKLPNLPSLLTQLSAACDASALLSPLSVLLAERLGVHATYRDTLAAIVREADLSSCAEPLAASLISVLSGPDSADSAAACILRALRRRYPVDVDRASTQSLRSAKTLGNAEGVANQLRLAFGGTPAQPVAGHDGVALEAGLSHPSPQVRLAALRELEKVLVAHSADGVSGEDSELMQPGRLRNALLACVRDTNQQSAAVAVGLPCLATLVADDSALFIAARDCLASAVANISGNAGGKSGSARAAVKRALRLLALELPQRTPALRDASASLLVGYLLDGPASGNVGSLARKYATNHPLFEAFSAAGPSDDSLTMEQRATVRLLGDALAGTAGHVLVQWVCASWPDLSDSGRLILLLALGRAIAVASQPSLREALATCVWDLLKQDSPLLCAPSGESWDSNWKDGLPPDDLFAAWAPSDLAFSGSVRRRVLLAAVADLPMETPPTLGALSDVFALGCEMQTLLTAHADAALSRASMTMAGEAFLCLLVGAEPGDVKQAAQLRACSLLASTTNPSDVLPHLLVALASPRRAVRRAAADSLVQISSGPSAKSRNSPFGAAVAWLATHREALLAGGNAPQLLAALLSSRGAAGVALQRMVLDLLASGPRPYAALQLLRGLNAVVEGTESIAASLQTLWAALCKGTTITTEEYALAEACASALAVSSARPQGGAAWTLLSGALLRPVPCGIRSAVLRSLDASVYAARAPHEQEALFARCLLIAAHDELEECRSAARLAVLSIGPDADVLARLIYATSKAIIAGCSGAAGGAAGDWLASMDAADVLTSVLESFAWHPATRPASLLAPIFSAADALLHVAASQAPRVLGGDEQDEVTWEDPGRATLHYRITQAMDGAAALVRAAGPNAPVSVSVAIRALRTVPDNGVHRAALELLSACAQTAPERVADDVADVTNALAVEASTGGDDRAGSRALQEAFSAMAACWVTARPNAHPFAVVDALVDVLPAVPEHHRLPLLLALLRPLPSPQALTHALQLLVAQPALSDFAGTVCASRPAMECFSAWLALVQDAAAHEDLQHLVGAIQFTTRQLRAPVHAAWACREHANPVLQASLSGLVVLSLSLLQRFSGKSDTDERVALQQLLTGVEGLMPPVAFLCSLVQLAAGEDAQVQRRALRLAHARLQSAAESPGVSAHEYVALISPLISIVARQGGSGADGKGTALEVLTELILRHGPSPAFADALMPSLPVLFVGTQHSKPAFAARSLECLKAVMVLGTRLVPILPDLVPALLSVLDGDCIDSKRTVAALDAVAAMVDRLDAFLSPFVPRLLELLLAPRLVLHAAPGVLSASAAARVALATRTPARLALPALLAAWEATLQLGVPCAVALVCQLAALVKALDTATAGMHGEAIFAFSLRILDVRRLQPQCADIEALEEAGLDVAVSLVLQLSEARFTPLFMTALEWSRARSDGLFRPLAFFRLVSALAAALRSVFVPFFRHLLADAVVLLQEEEEAAEATRPVKKPRTAHAAAEFAFRLRTEVVRALGLLFVHDGGEFLDEGRFSRLLPPLVQQLELPVPSGVLADEAAAAEATLVDSLSQMARCAGQDALWRQLNRSVLLVTRSEAPRARRLGLAVIVRMVDTLAEEYLTLLPETLPFLAELLEDGDEEVEAAARRLVDSLSRISEEDVLELLK